MVKTIQTTDIPPPPSQPAHWAKKKILVGDYFVKRSLSLLLRVSKTRSVDGKPTAIVGLKNSGGTWMVYDEFYQHTLVNSKAFARIPPEDVDNWRNYL